jgi:hypothetical protein
MGAGRAHRACSDCDTVNCNQFQYQCTPSIADAGGTGMPGMAGGRDARRGSCQWERPGGMPLHQLLQLTFITMCLVGLGRGTFAQVSASLCSVGQCPAVWQSGGQSLFDATGTAIFGMPVQGPSPGPSPGFLALGSCTGSILLHCFVALILLHVPHWQPQAQCLIAPAVPDCLCDSRGSLAVADHFKPPAASASASASAAT